MWLNSQSQLSSLTLVAKEDYPRGIDKGGRPLSGTQLWVQVRPISLLHIQGYMIGDMYSHDMCSRQNMLYSSTYTFIGLLNNVQSSLDSLPEPDADWPGLWVGRYFRPLALGRVGPPLGLHCCLCLCRCVVLHVTRSHDENVTCIHDITPRDARRKQKYIFLLRKLTKTIVTHSDLNKWL